MLFYNKIIFLSDKLDKNFIFIEKEYIKIIYFTFEMTLYTTKHS